MRITPGHVHLCISQASVCRSSVTAQALVSNPFRKEYPSITFVSILRAYQVEPRKIRIIPSEPMKRTHSPPAKAKLTCSRRVSGSAMYSKRPGWSGHIGTTANDQAIPP